MLAMLVGVAMIVRDTGMSIPRLSSGTVAIALALVVAGAVALAVSHVRTTRSGPRTKPV